jgi:hypothetical protein
MKMELIYDSPELAIYGQPGYRTEFINSYEEVSHMDFGELKRLIGCADLRYIGASEKGYLLAF